MSQKIIKTKLCNIFGIEYPIVQAGMGTVSGPTLVSAVSNAGGLGVLGAIDLSPENLQAWIKRTKELTDKPFGVDTVFPDALPDFGNLDELESKLPKDAVSFVEKLLKELELPKIKGRPNQLTVSKEVVEEQLEVILEEKIPVVVSALGNPGKEVVSRLHQEGVVVMGCVGNVKNAKRLSDAGVDIIIAQGHEAGGHTGRIGTLALVPQVIDAIYPKPVLAAGGIADGRGLVAALSMGAIGIWVGTRFVATLESSIDHVLLEELGQWEIDLWKEMIIKANEEDTRITKVFTGKPVRTINNEFIRTWEGKQGPILPMPLQAILIGGLQEAIRKNHRTEYANWLAAGQISGMINNLKRADQIIDEMVTQAIDIIRDKMPKEIIIG